MINHVNMYTKNIHKMFSNIKNSEDGRLLTFDIKGLSISVVNALRRTILTNIPNIGFSYEPEKTITIIKNTTGLNDEFIAHRISLIPVMIKEWMDSPALVNINDYSFLLKVSQSTQENKNGLVTTDDFVVKRNETVLKTDDFFPRNYKYKTPIPPP